MIEPDRGRCQQQSASGWIRTCGRCACPVYRLSWLSGLVKGDMRHYQCPLDVSALAEHKFLSSPVDLRSYAGSNSDDGEAGVVQGVRMTGTWLFPWWWRDLISEVRLAAESISQRIYISDCCQFIAPVLIPCAWSSRRVIFISSVIESRNHTSTWHRQCQMSTHPCCQCS